MHELYVPKNCFFYNFKHLQKRVFKFVEMFRSIFHATLIQIMTFKVKEGTIFKHHVPSLRTCHYHPARMPNSSIICNDFI